MKSIRLLLLLSLVSHIDGHEKLCKIAISSDHSAEVALLKSNTKRLSRGYHPKRLTNAKFTRSPWKGKPTYHVTVIEPTYLYFFGINSTELKSITAQQKQSTPNLLESAFLKNFFKPQRIFVGAGDHFLATSYEGCLIAKQIIPVTTRSIYYTMHSKGCNITWHNREGTSQQTTFASPQNPWFLEVLQWSPREFLQGP